jgi:hypothetical protein
MSDDIPIVTFDTSAHNRLVKDGTSSRAVLAAIKAGWFFRFAALSIEELVSTPDTSLRAAFFSSCADLQNGPNDCLYPQNELIRLLVLNHFRNPATFDWRMVDVSAPEYEDALRSGSFVNDQQIAAQQSQEMKTRKTDYKEMFCRPRQPIKEVFEKHKEAPPTTLREAITRLQGADAALIWSMGKWLYDRGADTDANESSVKHFMSICPPFRALIYAMLMSWYNFGVRDPKTGQRFNAGANDQFMSIYLPYCDKFVTADEEQQKCLGEIAHLADVKTEVLSYDKFVRDLLRP